MKTISALILSSMAFVASVHAAESFCVPYTGDVNYKCIAESLNAYDSDIFYGIDNEEIDSLLRTCASVYHDKAVSVAQGCASQACSGR